MTAPRCVAGILLLTVLLGGCAAEKVDPALEKQRQIQLQRMQTRTYDTNDKKLVIRGVIAALQDLKFVITNADVDEGIVTAKKFGAYPIDMTVSIQAISDKQMLVHGIAESNLQTIEEPLLYEQFFSSFKDFAPSVARTEE